MKQLYITSIALAGLLLNSMASLKATVPQQVSVDAVADFVYPANTVASPRTFTYMPDGLSYLMLNEDGTRITSYDTATGNETGTVLD